MKNIEQKLEKEVWSKLQKLEIATIEVEVLVKEYISAKITDLFPDSDSIELAASIAVKTYNAWKVYGDQKSVDQIVLELLQKEVIKIENQEKEENKTEILTGIYDELGDLIDVKSIWKN